MSKSCCFAFVFAVICLSLEADAQPTVDETMTCSSSTLEDVVNMVTVIASNQQENAKEIKDEIKDDIDLLRDEVRDVKRLLEYVTRQAGISALVCEYLLYFKWVTLSFTKTKG